jgi:hypothetical protein
MDPVLTFSEEHQAWIVVPSHTLVGVFVKSLHLIAVSWLLTVLFLWVALEPAERNAFDMVLHAFIPAVLVETTAWGIDRWIGSWSRHAYARVQARGRAREWRRAVSWTAVPVVLLVTAAVLTVA